MTETPKCMMGLPSSAREPLHGHGTYEGSDLRWNFSEIGDHVVVQIIEGSEIVSETFHTSIYRTCMKLSEYGTWKTGSDSSID